MCNLGDAGFDTDGIKSKKKVKLTFGAKINYLNQLPEHRLVHKGNGNRYFDIGTRRPWDSLSIRFLMDMISEAAAPIDIAYLTRRDYQDVLAMYRIVNWAVKPGEIDQVETVL